MDIHLFMKVKEHLDMKIIPEVGQHKYHTCHHSTDPYLGKLFDPVNKFNQ